jgi:hypothetical protein
VAGIDVTFTVLIEACTVPVTLSERGRGSGPTAVVAVAVAVAAVVWMAEVVVAGALTRLGIAVNLTVR